MIRFPNLAVRELKRSARWTKDHLRTIKAGLTLRAIVWIVVAMLLEAVIVLWPLASAISGKGLIAV